MLSGILGRKELQIAAICLSLLLVVSGCGKGSDANGASASPDVRQTETATAPPQEETEQGTGERVVSHALGELTIPAEPERIVVLNYMPVDHLLSLGIRPIAVATMDGLNFPPYLEERLQGVIPIGNGAEPNLEAILAAEPDLIIAHAGWHAEIYETLSRIAPTVLQDFPSDKIEWFKATAALFGKEEQAEAIVAEFDRKVEEARARLEETGANKQTVAIMRVRDKQLQIFGVAEEHEGELFGAENLLHERLGIQFPPIAGVELNYGLGTLSWELLPEVNPDYIFMLSYPVEGSARELEELQDNLVWKGLKAVQNNHVYMAENSTWVAGNGMIGLNRVLDEVLQALLGD